MKTPPVLGISLPTRLILLIATLIAMLTVGVLTPRNAKATSVYEVHVCDPSVGDVNNAFKYSSNDAAAFAGTADCDGVGGGLGVEVMSAGQAGGGQDTGAWTVSAPPGEEITGLQWTGQFDAFDGWTSFWRGQPTAGDDFDLDPDNGCGPGSAKLPSCKTGVIQHSISFDPLPHVQLAVICHATNCPADDPSSDFGAAGSANLYQGIVVVSDPYDAPELTASGSLWDENGQWISGLVPPTGGWGVSASATDSGSICSFLAFLTPSGAGVDQQVDEQDDSNTADFTELLPCSQTNPSLSWQPGSLGTLANGNYDLHVQATNPANGETDQFVTLEVDNEPPPAVTGLTASSSEMGPLGWSATPDFALNWTTPTDDPGPQSPVTSAAVVECEPDGSNCNTREQSANPSSASVDLPTGATGGDYRGFVWDIDQADNQGPQTAVDLPYDPSQPSAPELTPAHPGPVGQKQAATESENLSSTAGPSGLYAYQVSVDSQPSAAWQNTNSNGTYDLSTLSDGQHTLYARAFSGAGVPGPVSQTSVDIEQNGPDATVTPSPTIPSDGQVFHPITFTLGCVDRADPGCASITYSADGATPVTVPGDTATVTVSGVGQHSLTVYSTDSAANQSATTTARFSIATPGTPPPVNPPAVFTVTPAPKATDINPAYKPPLTISGLINGTYVNQFTKYLTITPTPPVPLKPATVTVTAGNTNVTLACATACKYAVPSAKMLPDGVHTLCVTTHFTDGNSGTADCQRIGIYRTADAWAVNSEEVSNSATHMGVLHVALWTAIAFDSGADLLAINRAVLQGDLPPMPTNWQSYINGDEGSNATSQFWAEAAKAGYKDVSCVPQTSDCYPTGTHDPWCSECKIYYQAGNILLSQSGTADIAEVGFGAAAQLFGGRYGVGVQAAGMDIPTMVPGTTIRVNSLQTQTDNALFWSGLGDEGDDVAKAYAKAHELDSLETVLSDRSLSAPPYVYGDPVSQAIWGGISEAFANGASGTVRVLQGNSVSLKSIWRTVEYPALTANPNVTEIIAISNTDGQSSVLWKRK